MTARWLGLGLGVLLLVSCAREPGPEDFALEYGRALYARDLAQAYRLISTEDRRVKDEQTFLRERDAASGFALEVARQLASFITATPTEKTIRGERVTVRLKLTLPNANAPEVAGLVYEWDEGRLNAISEGERGQITQKLAQLHQAKKIPMIEGEETFELVREGSSWRVFLNWAGGVRIRFHATMQEASSLQVSVSPEEVLATPGERVQVIVRAKNLTRRDVTTRVSHRIEPEPYTDALALLQCPLFVPVIVSPGQSEEFRSEYLVLKDVPQEAKQFEVTYVFLLMEQGRRSVR